MSRPFFRARAPDAFPYFPQWVEDGINDTKSRNVILNSVHFMSCATCICAERECAPLSRYAFASLLRSSFVFHQLEFPR